MVAGLQRHHQHHERAHGHSRGAADGGVGHKFLLSLPAAELGQILGYHANLISPAFDYVARQKVGGTAMAYFIFKQLPVLPPETYRQPTPWQPGITLRDWILPRVLELTYTAYDLEPFARDCGYDGPPFRWDEERRFLLRCELDAAYFHLYGILAEDLDYIMDTFPSCAARTKPSTASTAPSG